MLVPAELMDFCHGVTPNARDVVPGTFIASKLLDATGRGHSQSRGLDKRTNARRDCSFYAALLSYHID
jgi:hypothetical protein